MFKAHQKSSVKNVATTLQNVRVTYVCLFLLLDICIRLKIGSKKREEILNIGINMETKAITLLNDAQVFLFNN